MTGGAMQVAAGGGLSLALGLGLGVALNLAVAGSALAATPATLADAPQQSVAERLSRLERIVNSQGLIDMQVRLDSLQQDVQQLRGQIEVQNHMIEELKRRQRDLYVDIDRRLSQLERAGGGGAGASAPMSSPASSQASNPASSQAAASAAAAASTAPTGGGAKGSGTKPMASAATSGAAFQADPAKEQQAYQLAFDLLRELRYDQAINAFRKFLKEYPHGRYAHIAQYWVAEANYAQRRFKDAIADYQDLLDDYPNSPKRAEAMLKIGYSYYELGDIKRAEESLQNLINAYPKTTEAGQAQNLMQKMRVQASKPAQ